MNTKVNIIAKILAACILIVAISKYELLLMIPQINYGFGIQYIGLLGMILFFGSAIMSFAGIYLRKKWGFIGIYIFIVSACLLATPTIPFAHKLFQESIQIIVIFTINLICLFGAIWLHKQQRKEIRT